MGFGFLAFDIAYAQTNMLTHYVPPSSGQQYAGQRTTGLNSLNYMLSYDLGRWGLPDGQLIVWGMNNNTTDAPNYTQNVFDMVMLAVYGTALNRSVEYQVGYIPLNEDLQGNNVGGNANNPLGPASATQVLVGGNVSTETTPSAIVKWHITDNFYNISVITRSTPGTLKPGIGFGGALTVEHYSNPTAFDFTNSHPCVFGVCYHSPRELFAEEIGYKSETAPNHLFTWMRGEAYYNNTSYYDMRANNGSTTSAYAFSGLVDQQLWQSEPESLYTAYKGLYVGATIGYNSPQQAAYTQDYEARIYTFGMFGRPKDQMALSYQHLTVSPYLANIIDAANGCAMMFVCTRHGINNYTLSYTANIVTGVFASLGVTYTDHPSPTWSPLASNSGSNTYAAVPALSPLNIQGSLNLLAAVVVVF
jgi:porin